MTHSANKQVTALPADRPCNMTAHFSQGKHGRCKQTHRSRYWRVLASALRSRLQMFYIKYLQSLADVHASECVRERARQRREKEYTNRPLASHPNIQTDHSQAIQIYKQTTCEPPHQSTPAPAVVVLDRLSSAASAAFWRVPCSGATSGDYTKEAFRQIN